MAVFLCQFTFACAAKSYSMLNNTLFFQASLLSIEAFWAVEEMLFSILL